MLAILSDVQTFAFSEGIIHAFVTITSSLFPLIIPLSLVDLLCSSQFNALFLSAPGKPCKQCMAHRQGMVCLPVFFTFLLLSNLDL